MELNALEKLSERRDFKTLDDQADFSLAILTLEWAIGNSLSPTTAILTRKFGQNMVQKGHDPDDVIDFLLKKYFGREDGDKKDSGGSGPVG